MKRALAVFALAAAACAPQGTTTKPAVAPLAPSYTPSGGIPGPTHVAFRLAKGGPRSLFDRPWPSELARTPDGRLDLAAFPAAESFLVAPFVREAEKELDGFSLAPVAYFRFEGANPAPPHDVATKPDAPILLVDVDPASAHRGELVPVETHVYDREGTFVAKGLLAVRPVPGFVLRERTLYAAVVRRELGDANGTPLGTTDDEEAIKWTSPRSSPEEEAARKLHEPAFATLDALGVPRGSVAAIAMFRTQSATSLLARAPAAVDALPSDRRPRIVDAHWDDSLRGASYDTIVGHYCTPNFQERLDEAPFLRGDGGSVRADANGRPREVDVPPSIQTRECGPMLLARFVLTVPRAQAPAGGFPVAVTAHGTGGDATTFVGERDFAGWAAKEGVAVVSTDQPLHGKPGDPGRRPGAGVPLSLRVGGIDVPLGGVRAEMLFYNPLSPSAARGNLRQATLDAVSLVRLFDGLDLATMPLAGDRPRPKLRNGPVLAAGHSQGSQSMAILGAVEPRISAVALSGCGGDLRYGVLENREFGPVRELLVPLLGLAPGELDAFHPLLALVQTLADATDPESYASLYVAPPEGRTPASVLHVEGLHDTFVPAPSSEALAAALRATPIAPLVHVFPALRHLGLAARDVVRGNAAGGRATIAFAQIAPTHREDGHFVVYYEPSGEKLFRELFRTGQDGGPATLGLAL